MSGSINAYLPGLLGASNSSTSSLLDTFYGYGQTGGASQNPIAALASAEVNETKQVAVTAKQPDVARDIANFRKAVGNAKDVKSLLANPTAMKVLLTANGLGDRTAYTALATKALMSNVNDSKSLANNLSDTRWKTVAQTYDFANKGLAVLQNPQVLDTIANGYAEVAWRKSLDATTPGLSNALTFRAEAANIKSVDQILGDPVMRDVVTTALGVPKQIAYQDLTAQEQAISTRLDITKFSDPKFVETFVQRYLITAASNSTQSAQPDLMSLAMQSRGLVV